LFWLNRLIRGLNFMNALWYAFTIFVAIRYWTLPMNSPELPTLAHNPWGRWLVFLVLLALFLLVGAAYTLAFWMGLAKLVAWIVRRTLRGVWRTVLVMAHGVWFVACGLAWLVCRGWHAASTAWRRRRLAKMPRGVVIDIEGVWLDEHDTQQRAG
jgi:hypothetical protein